MDIGGETVDILARMGVTATRYVLVPFLSAGRGRGPNNRPIGARLAQLSSHGDKYEIHRDDLLDIPFAAVDGSAWTVGSTPTVMSRASLASAFANTDVMSDALFTRYRDMMLAPGV